MQCKHILERQSQARKGMGSKKEKKDVTEEVTQTDTCSYCWFRCVLKIQCQRFPFVILSVLGKKDETVSRQIRWWPCKNLSQRQSESVSTRLSRRTREVNAVWDGFPSSFYPSPSCVVSASLSLSPLHPLHPLVPFDRLHCIRLLFLWLQSSLPIFSPRVLRSQSPPKISLPSHSQSRPFFDIEEELSESPPQLNRFSFYNYTCLTFLVHVLERETHKDTHRKQDILEQAARIPWKKRRRETNFFISSWDEWKRLREWETRMRNDNKTWEWTWLQLSSYSLILFPVFFARQVTSSLTQTRHWNHILLVIHFLLIHQAFPSSSSWIRQVFKTIFSPFPVKLTA